MGWGDEIMVTGMARRLQEKSPLPVRVVDKAGRPRWNAVWNGNPRFAAPGRSGRVQTLVSGPGRRPYIAGSRADRWLWRDWICPVGEVHFSAAERDFGARHAGRVFLEPALKSAASPNKAWPGERWAELARRLVGDGHAVAQFDVAGTTRIDGVEAVRAPSFRHAWAALAQARLAVLPEGGLHHAAAASGTPSIVLFGGFISPRQTGYAHQVNLFTGGTPCGMRRRCRHCEAAMRKIDVDEVHGLATRLLEASAPA